MLLTQARLPVGRLGEAHVAVALVGAGRVAAVAVLAQRGVVGALVDVDAGVPVALVAGVAEARVGAVAVAAGGARVAAAVVGEALVHVLALGAVAAPAVAAPALERTLVDKPVNIALKRLGESEQRSVLTLRFLLPTPIRRKNLEATKNRLRSYQLHIKNTA